MTQPTPQFGRIPTAIISAGVLMQMNETEVKLYLAMCAFSGGRDWSASVSIERLAGLLGKSDRTIQRVVSKLADMGLIEVKQGGGRRQTNRYTIARNPDTLNVTLSTLNPDTLDVTVSKRKPRRFDTERVTDLGLKGDIQSVTRSECSEVQRGKLAKKPDSQNTLPGITPKPTHVDDQDKAVAFTFATTAGPWSLTHSQRDRLREDFPHCRVDTELAGLANWTEANQAKRKPPAGMFAWLRNRLAIKQAERPLSTPANYDGFVHASLPTDPTSDEAEALIASFAEGTP